MNKLLTTNNKNQWLMKALTPSHLILAQIHHLTMMFNNLKEDHKIIKMINKKIKL